MRPFPSQPLSPRDSLGTIDYLAPEILDCPVKHHPEDYKDRPDTGYTNKVGEGAGALRGFHGPSGGAVC
jgi:hypothetical protein